MQKILLSLILGVLLFSSCEKILMTPKPETSNTAIFEEYTKLVKEKFSMLKYKNVDIDYLHDSIKATITDDMSENDLFGKLSVITKKLRDGHSTLSNGDTVVTYEFYKDAPEVLDYDIIYDYYINPAVDKGTMQKRENQGELVIIYGHFDLDPEIAYVRIGGWKQQLTDIIDDVFKDLEQYQGLILDLRGNSGGDPVASTSFARHLVDKNYYIGYERFKTGPAEADTAISELYINPAENNLFVNKPVIVLTDIWCFSATTTFMYSVDPAENIVFMGGKTGGGAGSMADGYLANGWVWSLSVSEFIDRNGKHWDNGHEPDIEQFLDENNPQMDEVLERAYQEIYNMQ